jgi:Protein of unknown function (DUF3298)
MKIIPHLFIILIICWQTAFAEDDLSNNEVKDRTQVYHVFDEDDVDLIARVTYRYYPQITIKSVYPQLESDNDTQNLDDFNSLIMDTVDNLIDNFKSQIKQDQNLQTLPKKLQNSTLNIDFNSAGITANQDHILSIRLNVQSYIGGMAHPAHQHVVINYNLSINQKMELQDLFLPDSDYLSVIAEYVRTALSRRLMDKEMLETGTAPTPDNYKNWNLQAKGLLITFDEGQVTPYVAGSQAVLIPYSQLKKIISPDSPLAKCIKRKYCVQKNVVTGGFIDQI